jgi:spore maturation protein CgeB
MQLIIFLMLIHIRLIGKNFRFTMKILLVGDWLHSQYESVLCESFRLLQIEVIPFKLHPFFRSFSGKVIRQIPLPTLNIILLNFKLLLSVKKNKPDFVFLWRVTHVFPFTIKSIKSHNTKIITYNNDDPFGPLKHGNVPWHHNFMWYWYLKSIKFADLNLFYRKINIVEAINYGAINCELFLPYYIPDWHKPINLSYEDLKKYDCDIVFIGHYEDDGRIEIIKGLIDRGYKVKIWGSSYWSEKVLGEYMYKINKIENVNEVEYAKAVNGAKIALGFLSKINRDTYTRRCFEIPACGGLLLCERTSDLTNFFKEDVEACFFSNPTECFSKVDFLINNIENAKKISKNGKLRVVNDGHDIHSRTNELLNKIKKLV